MSDKLINFLKIQPSSCRYVSFPRSKGNDLASLLALVKFIRRENHDRLFILHTLNNTWHLCIGISSTPLPTNFTAVVMPFTGTQELSWIPAIHLVITPKFIQIELSTASHSSTSGEPSFSSLANILLELKNSSENLSTTNNSTAFPIATETKNTLKLTPDFSEFRRIIELFTKQCTEAQSSPNILKKVVLSRTCCIELSSPLVEPADTLIQLAHEETLNKASDNYFCAFIGGDDDLPPYKDGFVSYSPETLFTCKNKHLSTEALAGSSLPQMAQALIKDPKNLNENLVVQESIINGLKPLCTTIKAEAPQIRALSYIAHISTTIVGQLKPDAPWEKVIHTIFPSPAIAGFPRKEALDFIHRYNNISRGLFTGTAGFISGDQAIFTVLLRCATIETNKVTVMAGAGIMPDSNPLEEWQETAQKMYPVLKSLWPQEAKSLLQYIKSVECSSDISLKQESGFFHDK